MPQYHQTLILIDVTDAALANHAYTERANRLLECVNKPDTMKANVACVTDKIHKMIVPGQLISFGLMSKMSGRGDTFNPNSEAVTAFIKNANFQVVIPFTATNNAKKSKPTAPKIFTASITTSPLWDHPIPKWDAPIQVMAVDPELDKLLAEEDEMHANATTAKLASKKESTFKNLVNVAPFGLPPVLMPKPVHNYVNFSEYYKTV